MRYCLQMFRTIPSPQKVICFKMSPVSSPSWGASQVVLVVKKPPANAADVGDAGSIPGSGRSPGGGHSNPLQYPCLENPMDRGAWQAPVHGVARLKWLSTCTDRVYEKSTQGHCKVLDKVEHIKRCTTDLWNQTQQLGTTTSSCRFTPVGVRCFSRTSSL